MLKRYTDEPLQPELEKELKESLGTVSEPTGDSSKDIAIEPSATIDEPNAQVSEFTNTAAPETFEGSVAVLSSVEQVGPAELSESPSEVSKISPDVEQEEVNTKANDSTLGKTPPQNNSAEAELEPTADSDELLSDSLETDPVNHQSDELVTELHVPSSDLESPQGISPKLGSMESNDELEVDEPEVSEASKIESDHNNAAVTEGQSQITEPDPSATVEGIEPELDLPEIETQEGSNDTRADKPHETAHKVDEDNESAAGIPTTDTSEINSPVDIEADSTPARAETTTVAAFVDTSELFQKDDEPPFVIQSKHRSWSLRKKIILIFSILLMLLIGGTVFAGTNRNKQNNTAKTTTPSSTTSSDNDFADGNSTLEAAPSTTSTTNVTSTIPATATPNVPTPTKTIQPTSSPTPSTSPSTPPSPKPVTPSAPPPIPAQTHKTYTVSYSSSRCFYPSTLTINSGDSIKFVNNSNQLMWPVTSDHPTHQLLSELNSGKNVSPGGSYLATLTKIGTWSYHNEAKLKCGGSITVKA